MHKSQIIRRRQGISQDDFALILGVPRAVVSFIEGQKALPTPETLEKMETALSVDRLQIFTKEELRLLRKQKNRHTIPEDYPWYHIHIVIPRNLKPLFTKESMNLAGYLDMHDWFAHRLADHMKRLSIIIEAKRKKNPNYHPHDDLRVLFESTPTFDYTLSKKKKNVKNRS